MGWSSSGALADLPRKARDAVDPAMRQMADDGGRYMTDRVRENTPIGKEMKPIGNEEPSVPGTLRDSIEQIDTHPVVGDDAGGYESGVKTDVLYAPYVEHGTGLWGPEHRKYRIEPKEPGGVLAFYARLTTPEGKLHLDRDFNPVEGGLVFANFVMHPGSPGQHMFAIGALATEASFDQVVKPGMDEWQRLAMA